MQQATRHRRPRAHRNSRWRGLGQTLRKGPKRIAILWQPSRPCHLV
jgi:hypothetical protein